MTTCNPVWVGKTSRRTRYCLFWMWFETWMLKCISQFGEFTNQLHNCTEFHDLTRVSTLFYNYRDWVQGSTYLFWRLGPYFSHHPIQSHVSLPVFLDCAWLFCTWPLIVGWVGLVSWFSPPRSSVTSYCSNSAIPVDATVIVSTLSSKLTTTAVKIGEIPIAMATEILVWEQRQWHSGFLVTKRKWDSWLKAVCSVKLKRRNPNALDTRGTETGRTWMWSLFIQTCFTWLSFLIDIRYGWRSISSHPKGGKKICFHGNLEALHDSLWSDRSMWVSMEERNWARG